MERYRQTFDEIISSLSAIRSEWRDDRSEYGLDLQP
jgi:hypothetical protein